MRDKLKEHRDQSRSKSIERVQDKYSQPKSSRKGYNDVVEDPRDHTYLSKLGEVNREALSQISPSKEYYSKKSQISP